MVTYLATALWGFGSGFQFTAEPPSGIERQAHLFSDRPEDILGCVLANFQGGNFEVASALLPLLQRDDSAYVWSAATHLLAYGAPQPHVRQFFDWARELPDDISRYEACSAALMAGNLWAVEPALEVYAGLSDPSVRDFLAADLSWVLEQTPGEVFAGPTPIEAEEYGSPSYLLVSPPPVEHASYAQSVMARHASISAQTSAQELLIAEGSPINLTDIARRLLARVTSEEVPSARIEQAWWMFGAMTGVDCREFFTTEGHLKRLTAAAILEEYLDSGAAERFEPGVRYFFGHRVPG